MGIYVANKSWKFRLKFPIRLRENQIFVVVRFLAAPCIGAVQQLAPSIWSLLLLLLLLLVENMLITWVNTCKCRFLQGVQ